VKELETIDKLYLELSQFTTATTKRELDLMKRIKVLEDALKWYQEKAVSVQVYLSTKNHDATMAVLTELSLDCGNRAKAALEVKP
jgi:hypothetical protein